MVPDALSVPFTDDAGRRRRLRDPLPRVGRPGPARARVRPRRRRARALVDARRRARSPTSSACSPSTCRGTATAATATATSSSSGPTRSWRSPRPAASTGRPVVIGHSMGGFVTIATAALHADRFAGVIVVRLAGHRTRSRDRRVPAHARRSAARARTRPSRTPLRGSAPCRRRSTTSTTSSTTSPAGRCGPVDGGWQWKFDRRIFAQFGGGMRSHRAALPVDGDLPARAAALRVRAGHRRHRCVDVRAARTGDAGHRDPRGRAPRDARPAARCCSPRSAPCSPTGTTPNRITANPEQLDAIGSDFR